MRRREKRLAELLEGGPLSKKQGRMQWLKMLRFRTLASNVREQELSIGCRVVSSEESRIGQAEVFDGLGSMSLHFHAGGDGAGRPKTGSGPIAFDSLPEPEGLDGALNDSGLVHAAEMLPCAVVQRLAMPSPHRSVVHQGRLITMQAVRTPALAFSLAPVRTLEAFRDRPTEIRDGNRFLVSAPVIHASQGISKIPYRRRSVDLAALNESERKSFIQEASVIKRIPEERAELLGIFRNIPIELVSRLRFLSTRNEILYSLIGVLNRSVTRVHDLAAVRDTASREVHLVPHRTRARSVNLSSQISGAL